MAKSVLEPWRRIFVNRSLNMSSIRSVGFDMDHTLAQYKRDEFESLAFRETLKKFIEAGYPSELSQLTFDPNFVIRGLMVDRERGNLLKVDGHKYVKKAFHGRKELTKAERHRLYNWQSFKAEDFLSIDTFFALSEVQLFIEIIDYMGHHQGKIQKSYLEVYEDLRKFIDLSHADGSIKQEVVRNLGQYIVRDKNKAKALLRLKDGGKRVFLLTNSDWDYTNSLMNYIFDDLDEGFERWQDYFDYIIVGAGKPGFFTGTQDFYKVDVVTGTMQKHSGKLERGNVYHGGNGHLFQTLTDQRGDEILYCGDHIYGDIIRSKEVFNWRTLLVVEELQDELKSGIDLAQHWEEIAEIFQERERLDETLQKTRSLMVSLKRNLSLAEERNDSRKIADIEKSLDKLRKKFEGTENLLDEIHTRFESLVQARENAIHPVWGDFMRVGLEKSRFAKQIQGYACLYSTDVANLKYYSPFKRFTSPYDLMPHDM